MDAKKNFWSITLKIFIVFSLMVFLNINSKNETNSFLSYRSHLHNLPRLCGWYAEDQHQSDEDITNNLTFYKSQGIECVNYMTDLPNYNRASKIAKKIGIQFYAWLPAMLGLGYNKKWLYDNHPEAYAVTKTGIHLHDQSVYGVPHYKFLCPNNPIVRNFLKEMYYNVSLIPEVDGINLDYIRYIEANLKEYNPIGDTCYCDYCVSSFLNKTGINISTYDNPTEVEEWNNYRVNVITTLVNEIAKIVHSKQKKISADVYPGPTQSTKQTRQKWDEWDLDMVFPMIYTGVFNRKVEWIGSQTGEGHTKLNEIGSKTSLYVGLQAEIMNNEDFKEGVDLAFENGAYGISVFRLNSMSLEKFEILRNGLDKFLEKNKKVSNNFLEKRKKRKNNSYQLNAFY